MKKIIINGRFFLNKITGLERMGYETLIELDKLVSKDDDIEILAPNECREFAQHFKNIKVRLLGTKDTPKWTTSVLRKYASATKREVVNMITQYSTSLNSIITISDVRCMEKDKNGNFYDQKHFRKMWLIQTIVGILCAKKIVTISEFSKSRIINFFHVSKDKIVVIPCAWQHYKHIIPDNSIFDRYQIEKGNYYYTVGSLAPHKNLKWIIEAAKINSQRYFVVSGGKQRKVWGDQSIDKICDNIVYTDYVTDEEMKALMINAKAFIFPTLYEGFGIPPLEAMSAGVDCIVSDIPVMHEIYGDSVHYIDPYDPNINLDEVLNEKLPITKEEILNKYSWEKAAKQWLALIRQG